MHVEDIVFVPFPKRKKTYFVQVNNVKSNCIDAMIFTDTSHCILSHG